MYDEDKRALEERVQATIKVLVQLRDNLAPALAVMAKTLEQVAIRVEQFSQAFERALSEKGTRDDKPTRG